MHRIPPAPPASQPHFICRAFEAFYLPVLQQREGAEGKNERQVTLSGVKASCQSRAIVWFSGVRPLLCLLLGWASRDDLGECFNDFETFQMDQRHYFYPFGAPCPFTRIRQTITPQMPTVNCSPLETLDDKTSASLDKQTDRFCLRI